MGSWSNRKTIKYGKLLLKTTRKLYRKNRRKIPPEHASLLGNEMAALEEAIRERHIQTVERCTEKLSRSFENYLSFAKKSTFREYLEAFVFAILLALILRTFTVQLFKIPTGSMRPTLHGARSQRWLSRPYGDHILVNKFIYGPQTLDWIGIPMTNWGFELPSWRFNRLALRKPQRGDIIVFKFPFHYHCGACDHDFDLEKGKPRACPRCRSPYIELQNKDFIKRVVGLPGETIEIRDGDIYVNDEIVTEPESIKNIYYRNIPPGKGLYGYRGQKVAIPENHYFVLGDNSGGSKDSRFWGFVPFHKVRGKAFFIYLPPWRIGPVS